MAEALLIPETILHDRAMREEARKACRHHLVHHDNMALRQKMRDSLGRIISASDGEHCCAYLEHDTHGEAIVRFFLCHIFKERAP